MSIFGIKSQQRNNDFEKSIFTLTRRVADLQNRLLPVSDLKQKMSEVQKNIDDISENIKQQAGRYKETIINNRLMYADIEKLNDKTVFTIFAESKGRVSENEIFSFGNGCSDPDSGYCVIRRCQILGLGFSSKRQTGSVGVGVLVNGTRVPGCEIVLNTTQRKHDILDTPFTIEAGSIINFVSTIENTTAICSVVSLLLKLT